MEEKEKIIEIEIERLKDFKEHPFQVKDDEEMRQLKDSISEYGVLNPLDCASCELKNHGCSLYACRQRLLLRVSQYENVDTSHLNGDDKILENTLQAPRHTVI